MPNLQLSSVDKFYGDVHAVKGVSLEVPEGEFIVLVGPSGCGKSTLLRSIAGLEEISGGDISLGGRSIVGLAPRDRNIAMVFQSYALYPYLSVYENIAFGLRARKFSESEIERQVGWASELLAIGDFLQRFPRELSGGQRQRVAIGRAIVREADLFLLDEPLSNLDAKLRDGMREEIKRLHRQLGKTFIYVTHDQIEAMTLAERIVLLRDGVVEQEGAPLELFERPRNRFVAGFLGSPSMNFIEVEQDGDGPGIRLPDGQIIDKFEFAPEFPDGGKLVWGVRPEHFSVASGSSADMEALIEVVQPTGSRTFGSFTLSGTHVVAELDARAQIAADQKASLSIDVERTTFFSAETGEAC
ncbi:MAG: ATP-binding cassette domain-containing protein [Albidovulum sp.]|nr:ATP-binding cassette domain-containing protein [Albidovulum sp.]